MSRLAFGGFELDPVTGDLRKEGGCVRIQEQPLRLLLCLLERPGELVGREELHKRMWDEGVHVDFEDGLNAAAWRLRQVLGDSTEKPRFIETIPKKGYRFVGKVQPLPGHPPPPSGSFPMPIFRPDSGLVQRPALDGGRAGRRRLVLGSLLALGLLGGSAGTWVAFRPRSISLELPPLKNITEDPTLDFFATALTRQVMQDLQAERDLETIFGGEAAASRPGPAGARLRIGWTLEREEGAYRILVAIQDGGGNLVATGTFVTRAEDLHEVHRRISAFLVARARSSAA